MRAQRARKGAEGTRPLRRISPARMPSSKKSDPAPVGETALRFGFAARGAAPCEPDANIKYMIAVARIIINRWHKGDDEVLKSIQKDINRPIFASLPNDFRKASQAVNLGTPLMENHNNTLTNRYRQIAGQLVGIDASVDEKKSPLSSLFSFPSKK